MEKWQESAGYRKAVTAFIACSKTKRSWECPARDLYQGELFRKAMLVVPSYFPNTYILSAKYGVVHPEEKIAPYNLTLKNMTATERKEWAAKVRRQMKERMLPEPFVFFTGVLYCEGFSGYTPLKGLTLGRQLRWFNQRLLELRQGKMKGLLP